MLDPLMQDLLGMLCFARVVERRSFTAAAGALGLSKSAVSTRVARLEERLGERLLVRTSRKLTVTDAGMGLYARCARMLEEATAAVRGASDADRGLVRLAAPTSFGQMYLARPIAAFLEANPGTHVELSLNDRLVDLVEERIDLAIRITKLKDTSLIARRIARTALHVVAAPAYLARRGRPERPEDLLQHACLRYLPLRAEDEWRLYGASGRIPVPVAGPLSTSSGIALREAALAGVGLAMLPRFMIDEDLRAGRLEPLLEAFAPRPVGIYAVHASGRRPPARVRRLIDWLAAAFRDRPWA